MIKHIYEIEFCLCLIGWLHGQIIDISFCSGIRSFICSTVELLLYLDVPVQLNNVRVSWRFMFDDTNFQSQRVHAAKSECRSMELCFSIQAHDGKREYRSMHGTFAMKRVHSLLASHSSITSNRLKNNWLN